MARGPFSGWEVAKVMVNSGIFEWGRRTGDHAIRSWEPSDEHDSEARRAPVPLHDELSEGTLREIGEQAGMRDYREFTAWIDRNR